MKLDPKLIYLQAERFLYYDHRLRSPQIMTTPQDGAYVALPAVVLSVFASELYLKCLLCLEGFDEPPHGHKLWKLFKRLNRSTKENISALWDAHLPSIKSDVDFIKAQFGVDVQLT